MLLGILGTLLLASIACGASFAAFPRLRTDATWAASAGRLLVGGAILVLVLHILVQFVPAVVASWLTIGLVVAGLLGTRLLVRERAGGPALRARGRMEIVLLAIMGGLALWRLWPVLSIGFLTTFEGTGNHDEVHYVLVAEWLLGNPARAPIPVGPGLPYASAAQVALHAIPRYGAELVVALLSAVTGYATFESYPVAMATGSLLWLAAAALLVQSAEDRSWPVNALALGIAAANPVAAYMVANGNLATLFGCAFLAGYSYFLLRSTDAQAPLRDAIAAGVLLGATVVTYGEVVPLAAVVTAVTFAGAVACRPRASGFRTLVRPFAVAAVVGLLSAPFAVVDTFGLIRLNMEFVGSRLSAPYWDSMFDGRGPARALLTTLTLAPQLVATLSGTVAAVVAAAAVAVVASGTPRRLALAVAPLLAAGAAFLGFAVVTEFGYGKMKAIQLLSLPLAVVVGFAAAKGLAGVELRSWRRGSAAAGAAIVAGFFAYVAATTHVAWRDVAQTKHVSRDLVQLSAAAALLPRDATVFVSGFLGEHAFMNSRWVALFMRDTRLVFAPELQGGGYLYGLHEHYAERVQQVTHVLTGTVTGFAEPPAGAAAFQNGSFRIQPLPATGGIAQLLSGFHGNEGGTRWMDQTARVRIFGAGARRLRVEFPYRYPGASGSEEVTALTQDDGFALESKGGIGLMEIVIPTPRMAIRQVFPLAGGSGAIVVPVDRRAVQDVDIRSGLVATSPRERGESSDPRRLSFRVGRIEALP